MDGRAGEWGRRQPLPVRLTRFFGRQSEAEDLRQRLGSTRMLTLVGAPGCGKTRLGVEVADEVALQFDGGAQLVDLTSLAAGSRVADTVASALSIPEQPHRSILDTLTDALAEAELLLVLDNCEHVVEGAAETLSALLPACRSLHVLATSRAPLHVPGEQVSMVPPLHREAAVELFQDRAGLANASFRLSGNGRALVEEICDRLGHLPLAVELAAAWTRVLSPGQIVERLEEAGTLLSDGTHVTSARHATMEATVDWSYRLLEPGDQQLFEQLSVFAGGFDLAAVEAVAGSDTDSLRRLTALVDQSLVVTEAVSQHQMRYRVLEPVRQCSAARLAASGAAAGVRRNHATYYLALAEDADRGLRGPGPAEALARLEQERDNFRRAFEWARAKDAKLGLRLAIAVARHLEFSGRCNQARVWLCDMLELDGNDPRLRARGLGCLGRLLWRQGDYSSARLRLEESRALLQDLGDELAAARRLRTLSLVALSEGHRAPAADLGDQAVEVFRRHDDLAGLGWALVYRGWAHYAQGEVAAGDACMCEALSASERSGELTVRIQARTGLAYGADVAGDLAGQRWHAQEARDACHEFGGVGAEPESMWACFRLAMAEGRSRAALRVAGGALELSRTTGSAVPAPLMLDVERRLKRVRAELGPTLSDRLMAQGAAMQPTDLLAAALEAPVDPYDPLTVREAEVAELVGQGLSNVDIAEKLYISRRTVESHLEHIRQKLGLASRHELMAWVLRGLE